jgi:hypothetical protein
MSSNPCDRDRERGTRPRNSALIRTIVRSGHAYSQVWTTAQEAIAALECFKGARQGTPSPWVGLLGGAVSKSEPVPPPTSEQTVASPGMPRHALKSPKTVRLNGGALCAFGKHA